MCRYAEILVGVQWMIDHGHDDEFYFELMRVVQVRSAVQCSAVQACVCCVYIAT